MALTNRLPPLAALALLATSAAAQPAGPPQFDMRPIVTPAQPDAIPLRPGERVDGRGEQWVALDRGRMIRNVTVASIAPVLPDPARATGAAVLVVPGGAFQMLAIDTEGYQVARWLADHGIAAFVLRYRLNPTPRDQAAFLAGMGAVMAGAGSGDITPAVAEPRAAVDAIAALAMIRARAAEWHVDPARVGMIGFSAGAQTALQTVLTAPPGGGPAFFGYVYGPMRAVPVPAGAPPLFAAIALDDGLFGRQGFGIVEAWQRARRPVELHAYERGDHGFGTGVAGTTTTLVLPEFAEWLKDRGLLSR